MPVTAAPARRIRLLVVDDHPVVVDGVRLLVQGDPAIDVVGSAGCAQEAIERTRELQPDVILLDLRLPDMLATEAIHRLRAVATHTRVALFTAYPDHAAVHAALERGVDGCLLKDAGTTDLVNAIHRLACGIRVVDGRLSDGRASRLREVLYRSGVTRREYEVLRLVAMGHSNPEIGEELNLARNTVKTYLQSAMSKLGARNRVEAIAKAHQANLL